MLNVKEVLFHYGVIFLFIRFEVTQIVAANTQTAEDNTFWFVTLVFFSEKRNSQKNPKKSFKKTEKLHTASLKYKLLSSSAGTKEVLHGFDSILQHRREELTKKKTIFVTKLHFTIEYV